MINYAKEVVSDLEELKKLTSDEKGSQRVAWGATWRKAREWFVEKAKNLGGDISYDSAGNLWVKLEGKSKESIAIGSHLDSVPNGGWLDGCLGVVSALGFLRVIKETGKPEKTIYIVDFADEEGARFGRSLLGASAISGDFNVSELMNITDNEGIRLEEALKENGVNIYDMPKAKEEFLEKNIKAYLELHIEQGPVLEESKKDVACVYGITGVERWYVNFYGQSAHAGSFPVPNRKDAFLAAAEASLGFREIALKYNAVCTVGKVKVFPDVVTIVPSHCQISLDQRSINKQDLSNMLNEAREIAKIAGEKNGVSVSWENIFSIAPTLFNEDLIEIAVNTVLEETGEKTKMYSGPLHDAAEMQKVVPSVMLFAMSNNGLSHCVEEDTPKEALYKTISVFYKIIAKVIGL
jgi:N-carbamoyl-L-amino-acid hydrolase